MYSGIGEAFATLLNFALFAFFTLIACAIVLIAGLTPFWTPWFYVAFVPAWSMALYMYYRVNYT